MATHAREQRKYVRELSGRGPLLGYEVVNNILGNRMQNRGVDLNPFRGINLNRDV